MGKLLILRTKIMATVKINTAYNVNIDFELAGLDKRFIAWLIDFGIRFIYWLILANYVKSQYRNDFFDGDGSQESMMTRLILGALPVLFYFVLFEVFFNGQSIGKKIMKIRVVSIDGYKPTVTQYISRWLFRVVDVGFISVLFLYGAGIYGSIFYALLFFVPNIVAFILVLNNKKEQRLGDLMSGTVVIKLNPSTQLSDTIFTHVEKDYVVRYPNVLKLSDRDVTIIKTALQNAQRSGRDNTLWHIAEKLRSVLDTGEIGDPHYFLETVIRDYNYLSSN
jgi:uncharacterized RDD family membrane protein YckC